MSEKRVGRGMVLASASICIGISGAIYMWSIFKIPLMESNGWTSNQVTLAYSIFLTMVCLGGFFVKPLLKIFKSNILMLIAGIGLSIGWFLISYITNIYMLYLIFSLIAGGFDGIIYNLAVSTAAKWFPDKKGFANGVCIGGVGLSPLIFAPMGNFFIENYGAASSFRFCGIIFAVVYFVFSWFLKPPVEGWTPENWSNEGRVSVKSSVNLAPSEMLKTGEFWILWLIFAVAASSGLMMTGHASGIGQEQASVTAAQASVMVGLLALSSFMGRFGFGMLSDKIGRYKTLYIILLITALDMLFYIKTTDNFMSFMIALGIVGIGYGGVLTTLPSLCSDVFGAENFGSNYAFLFTGFTCACFVGPMTGSFVSQSTGEYSLAYLVAGLMAISGIVLIFIAERIRDAKMKKIVNEAVRLSGADS